MNYDNMEIVKRNGLSFAEKDMVMEGESNSVAKELLENLFFDMAKLSTKWGSRDFLCQSELYFV